MEIDGVNGGGGGSTPETNRVRGRSLQEKRVLTTKKIAAIDHQIRC